MATQMDVAEYARVSYMTVSRVVNNSASVRKETRERVLNAIRTLNYYPNSAAQVLAGGQTFNVGVAFPENEYVLSRQYFVELTNQIELSLSRHGYHLFLGAGRMPGQQNLRDLVGKGTLDGLLIVSPPMQDERLEMLAATRLPVVVIHGALQPGPFSVLDVDNVAATRDAMRHLWDLGHRDIGLVTGIVGEITGFDRRRTYGDFLAELGLAVRQDWTFEGDWSLESGYAGLETLMRGPHRPTAIVFSNDQMAFGGLKAAHDAGLRVPDDLSIVGFDNTKYSTFVSPELTTVDMRIDALAQAAVDALLDTIAHAAAPKLVSVPPVLIVRASSGPVSAHKFFQ